MHCEICGAEKELQIHHLSYKPEVTQILCWACHQEQHAGHGVGLPIGWGPKVNENRGKFSDLWDAGLTYNELMQEFNISYATVWNWVNILNKPKRLIRYEGTKKSPQRYTITITVRITLDIHERIDNLRGKDETYNTVIARGISALEAKLRTSEEK